MPLYGHPTKLGKSVYDSGQIEIEPQRFQFIPFWQSDSSVTHTDGENITTTKLDLGTKVVSHHVKQTMTPETIEPQEIYMATLKLSFYDFLAPSICGENIQITSGDVVTSEGTVTNELGFYNVHSTKTLEHPSGDQTLDIDTIRNDDEIPHFLRTRSAYIYDQSPMLGSRYMKVPAKVKRINPYTWYGLFIYNDSERGATPADTSIFYRLKQTLKYYAL
jgi:hypothetical protein